MDAKVKVAWQSLLLMRESNAQCPHNNRVLKNEEFKDQKDFKAKKNHHSFATNSNSGRRNKVVRLSFELVFQEGFVFE